MIWEYKVLTLDTKTSVLTPVALEIEFNSLGEAGWELVSSMWYGNGEQHVFKRPRQ